MVKQEYIKLAHQEGIETVIKQSKKELLLDLINKANYLKEDSYLVDYIKSKYDDLL